MELSLINELGKAEARSLLTNCCGASKWVEQMLAERPFKDETHLFSRADQIWQSLSEKDWLEAFSHHPKIGDLNSLKEKFASTANWAAGEQAGVATATEKIIEDLAAGNSAYEKKFGYIFIVCATGKSAAEMLSILQSRLPNPPEWEIKVAAEEQRKITRIRLEKLCR
ncbi:MAG: 2-oxo-4-hydroxy-4-carboxy-5-ureidoimidazoline decarboxylase [Candidatus Obscuribacterales bacterium]|nr:2-oxo-4-hydroxy-4-carboxy-5-ureidoimidazoline decarboxylase [Candidatus Obscuribacterales bacterium]